MNAIFQISQYFSRLMVGHLLAANSLYNKTIFQVIEPYIYTGASVLAWIQHYKLYCFIFREGPLYCVFVCVCVCLYCRGRHIRFLLRKSLLKKQLACNELRYWRAVISHDLLTNSSHDTHDGSPCSMLFLFFKLFCEFCAETFSGCQLVVVSLTPN